MAHEPGGLTSRGLRALFEVGSPSGLTDGQLLERFATHAGLGSEQAFEAIIGRHGPMVLRACRGILGDDHEAMDAFQATFLVLARKGRSLWVGDSLGPWLHRVACRAASKARAGAARRRELERRMAEVAMDPGSKADRLDDLASILHEELDRLPEHYRAAIVLCDLQGHTCEETARRLGCAVGTVGSRLSRGRERLRSRLARRGLAPTAGSIVLAFAGEALAAPVPGSLATATLRGAVAVATSRATAGASSAAVASLAEDVSRSLIMAKIRSITVGLAVACGLTLAAGGTYRAIARPQAQDPATAKPADPPAPKPAAKDSKQAMLKRHKDFLLATFGNMRPLIVDARGVRFQCREVILYRDGTLKVYKFDPADGVEFARDEAQEPMVPPLRHNGPIREVNVFNDEKLLITTSDDEVKVWDGLSCELKKSIEGQFMRPLFFGRGVGGGRFATVDVAGRVVTLWDAKTLEPVGTIRPEGSPRLIGAGLSKDGRTLATIGEDHSVTLRDAADGKPFATLRPPTPPIAGVFGDAISGDKPVLHIDAPFWEGVKFLLPPEAKPAENSKAD